MVNVSNKQPYSSNITDSSPNNAMVLGRWRPLLQIEANVRTTNNTVNVKQETNKTRNRTRLLLVPLVPLLKDWARIKVEGTTCEFDDEKCLDSEST
ncbi:hypothetical protein L9F63_021216, partial [Diploptera punctata]